MECGQVSHLWKTIYVSYSRCLLFNKVKLAQKRFICSNIYIHLTIGCMHVHVIITSIHKLVYVFSRCGLCNRDIRACHSH